MARIRVATRTTSGSRNPNLLLPGAREMPRAADKRGFVRATVTGIGAFVALGISSTMGDLHGHSLHDKLFALIGAIAFLVLAVVAVQSVTGSLGSVVATRAGRSGGTAVRVVTAFVGYVIVVFVGLGLFDVPVQHLLLGGALTGVAVGIAAQQALGNVFAGLVLLLARPFTLEEKVRVRAGALGGIFEGTVRSMTLSYVTIETDDGALNVPNSAMLAAAVGPVPPEKTAPGAEHSGAALLDPSDAHGPGTPHRRLVQARVRGRPEPSA